MAVYFLEWTQRELYPDISQAFKDQYVLEFLGLPETHSENDLQKALARHMKAFILELGKDFLFMAENYRLQVGNQDFYIDLLFYHRGLSALVAFELKIGRFMPEHMGHLNFYLSRNLSPALVAQYQLQLPDKKLIQAKLHEWYERSLDVDFYKKDEE